LKEHRFSRIFKRTLSKKLKRVDFQITLLLSLYFNVKLLFNFFNLVFKLLFFMNASFLSQIQEQLNQVC